MAIVRTRLGFRLLVAAGAALCVVAVVLLLRPLVVYRDFVPDGGGRDTPRVWTITCGVTLHAAVDFAQSSGLDPECYRVAPRKLVVPWAIGIVGVAAIAIGLFGRRTSEPADSARPVRWRQVGVIVGGAVVLAGLGVALPSLLERGPPILSIKGHLDPGDFVVPLADHPTRYYRAHVPTGLKNPSQMLLVLHGSTSRAEWVEGSTGFSAFADAHNILVIYPQARIYPVAGIKTGGYWGVQPCSYGPKHCWNPATVDKPDDIAYLRDVIADVRRRSQLDLGSVSVVGHSLGGTMAQRVGCEMADVITAVVAIDATMETNPCKPRRALPVLIMHAADDEVVPRNGNNFFRPLAESVKAWRDADRCTGPGSVQDASGYKRTTYSGCAGGAIVELILVPEGGHDWIETSTFDWRTVVWNFISRSRSS